MHSNHQDEREREIQDLKRHFENESFWTKLRDSHKLTTAIFGRMFEFKLIISISFVVGAAVALLLGFSPLTASIVGAVVSFVAMRLHARLRPDDWQPSD